ncbi:hypothetical protein [Spongiactinospora sp. TRM90649]|uniref:hypothetical protein n=1 Tax=Spongiactinospora sp. TRM90649 TaxID=3031114 RepID=UPI0023F93FA9|nr:hypothetical protein [Spongiactinospora sp. TRM90649]MDF5755967.1 hypothetical protein [Spongiactinospora sp. TRM90649]
MTGPAASSPRARRTRRARSLLNSPAALALTVAAAATSCGALTAQGGETNGGRPVPPLTATLQQARIDEAKHVLSVAVRNPGPEPVHIERIQLVAPPLPVLPPEPVDTLVRTTPRVDLRIPYGTATCEGATAVPVPGPAHALAWIREAGGARQIRLPLPHPDPLLTRLVRLDCGASLVRRSVDVRLGERWTREGDALTGVVVVERKGAAGEVTLQDIAGSVVFGLAPAKADGKPLAILAAGRARVDVPVRFTAPNCSAHTLADAKKPYAFPAWVGITGLEPQYLEFAVTPDLRQRLDLLVRETCRGE